jgi:hypothetical protein
MNKKLGIGVLILVVLVVGAFVLFANQGGKQMPSDESGAERQKVGEQRVVRSWEQGGTVVTLYEQDIVVAYDPPFSGPASEQILKAKVTAGTEVVLDRYESGQGYGKTVEDVYISPLGTYVTAEILGYESRYSYTYAARTGEQVLDGGAKKIPYWTSDEKKVALIQTDSGIDGTPAAFFYSATGDVRNAVLLREFAAVDWTITEVVQKENVLTITMTGAGGSGGERNYTFNIENGTFVSDIPEA